MMMGRKEWWLWVAILVCVDSFSRAGCLCRRLPLIGLSTVKTFTRGNREQVKTRESGTGDVWITGRDSLSFSMRVLCTGWDLVCLDDCIESS